MSNFMDQKKYVVLWTSKWGFLFVIYGYNCTRYIVSLKLMMPLLVICQLHWLWYQDQIISPHNQNHIIICGGTTNCKSKKLENKYTYWRMKIRCEKLYIYFFFIICEKLQFVQTTFIGVNNGAYKLWRASFVMLNTCPSGPVLVFLGL